MRRIVAHRQDLAGLVARRQKRRGWSARRRSPPPAAEGLFLGPALSRIGVQRDKQMQVVVEHRETANGKGKDLREFLEPAFDPDLP